MDLNLADMEKPPPALDQFRIGSPVGTSGSGSGLDSAWGSELFSAGGLISAVGSSGNGFSELETSGSSGSFLGVDFGIESEKGFAFGNSRDSDVWASSNSFALADTPIALNPRA